MSVDTHPDVPVGLPAIPEQSGVNGLVAQVGGQPDDAPRADRAAANHPDTHRRLVALDGLRFVAALAVVIFHFTAQTGFYQGKWYYGRPSSTVFPSLFPFTSYGWTGVELFFMISGFVICMSAWDKRLGDFAVSRVVRLYPAYWFAVLLTSGVLVFLPDINKPPTLRVLMINLTMFERPLHAPEIQGVFWTLWPELKFYLLFAVVVWRGLTYRRAVAFCVLWLIGKIIAYASANAFLHEVLNSQFSHFFIAGIVLYLIYRFGPNPLLWMLLGVTYLFAVYSLPGDFGWNATFHQPEWPTAVLYTVFFIVLTLLALGKLDWVRWRGLTVLGAITYPLYLIHEAIGGPIIYRLHNHIDYRLLLVLLIGGMIMAAWLIHRLVERPLAARLRRALQRGLSEIRRTDPHAPRDVSSGV